MLQANSSTAQQSLSFDSLEDQHPVLVSDNLFLYSSSVLSFNIQAFLNTLPGPLKNYSEELDGQPWSAAEIINYNAMRYGINPQLILILLEAQTELLTNLNAEIPKLPYSNPTRQEESTFHSHVAWSAEYLLSSFHKARYDESDNLIIFSSGEFFATPASANAGTYAVQATLARTLPRNKWELWVMSEEPKFIQQYTQWFGDPHYSPDRIETPSALPERYILPFAVGETWYYTSGPHNHTGGDVGCTSGPGCPRPWSAIDIAPPEVISCPGSSYPLRRWVVAAEGGTVIDSSQARVIIDHGDGWRTYYSHIATADRIEEGPVNQGQPIGHPSCEVEPGSSTSGVHIHFAIWQEGVGFVDISGSALSNWKIQESTHYNGTMSRNNVARTASGGRLLGTNDILNSVTLFSDTFSDGNFDGWTIVDAPGANSAPSDWSIVEVKGSLILLQNSNIHTPDEPYEGTYVYAGQSWWTDYYLNVAVEPDDNDGVFVLFRYIDKDNYYRFYMDRERNYRRLEKKVEGIYTTLAEDSTAGYGNGWINVRIIVSSDTIAVLLDHAPIFAVTDDSFAAGMIGLGTWGSTDCYFDNIIVTTSCVDPYADAVVDANIKGSGNGHTDTLQTLGRPNGTLYYDYVSVGGPGHWITLDMGEGEEVIDGPGNDFRIYEVGKILGGADEEYDVSVSNSPDGPWTYIGEGWTTSVFDLAGSGLDSARYVRIDDLSTRTGDPTPGSDIDAVQNLNMVGDLIIEAPRNLSKATSGNDVVLSWGLVDRADGYNVYASQLGGGVGFSFLDFVPTTTGNTLANLTRTDTVSYIHQNAADDEFYYVITAISPEGFESNFSPEVPYQLFLSLIIRG